MKPPVLQRRLQGALTVCLAAAGLLSFVDLAQAQAGAGGNPVDNLPTPPTPAANQPEAPGRILTAPPPAQPAVDARVMPQRIDIEGVKSIPFPEVAALFQPLVGQASSVARLTALARDCTALYQSHGYALSFCFIPQQDFAGGVVRVIAVEGHIASVKIEGDPGPARARIDALAERVRQERPLTLAGFDRYTQLMGLLPGVQVQATATPPTATDGAGSLLLKVTRKPYGVSLGSDFRTRKPRAVVSGVINDPIMPGGSLSASALLGGSSGEKFASGAYSQVVGNEGLTLKAELTMFEGNPDANRDIVSNVKRFNTYHRAELSASYPLLLKRSESIYLSGGVYGVNNAEDYTNPVNGASITDQVNTRALYAQASWSEQGETQSRGASLRLVHGITGLGADKAITANFPTAPLDNPVRLDFTRVLIEANQRNLWGARKEWGTAISLAVQHSPHSLPSTERVSFGSMRFGRAYQAGEIAGDSGWGVGLELNRSFAVPFTYVRRVQPFVLLEHARTSLRIGTPAIDKLTSASLGLRLSDNNLYSLDLAASKPIGDASPDNPSRDLRFSAQLSYSFSKTGL